MVRRVTRLWTLNGNSSKNLHPCQNRSKSLEVEADRLALSKMQSSLRRGPNDGHKLHVRANKEWSFISRETIARAALLHRSNTKYAGRLSAQIVYGYP